MIFRQWHPTPSGFGKMHKIHENQWINKSLPIEKMKLITICQTRSWLTSSAQSGAVLTSKKIPNKSSDSPHRCIGNGGCIPKIPAEILLNQPRQNPGERYAKFGNHSLWRQHYRQWCLCCQHLTLSSAALAIKVIRFRVWTASSWWGHHKRCFGKSAAVRFHWK